MSQGIKAVLPWLTFILSIILCAFLIYVAFFSYQAGKAPTVNKVEANITLVLAIILAILVGLLMIWSIIHLYQTNKTKPKTTSTAVAPENKPTPKTSETKTSNSVTITPSIPEAKAPAKETVTKAPANATMTNATKMNRISTQPKETYADTVSDPGANSAIQDLLRAS